MWFLITDKTIWSYVKNAEFFLRAGIYELLHLFKKKLYSSFSRIFILQNGFFGVKKIEESGGL